MTTAMGRVGDGDGDGRGEADKVVSCVKREDKIARGKSAAIVALGVIQGCLVAASGRIARPGTIRVSGDR